MMPSRAVILILSTALSAMPGNEGYGRTRVSTSPLAATGVLLACAGGFAVDARGQKGERGSFMSAIHPAWRRGCTGRCGGCLYGKAFCRVGDPQALEGARSDKLPNESLSISVDARSIPVPMVGDRAFTVWIRAFLGQQFRVCMPRKAPHKAEWTRGLPCRQPKGR